MRKAIAFIAVLLTAISLNAGNGVDSLFFDARGTFHQETMNGKYDSRLQADYLNFHMFGKIADNVTYRVRQRLNKGIEERNLFSATDWMCISWKATPKWTFTAGKTAILIGGYEYDSAPIDVYFYSRFCNELNQGFAFSVNANYEFVPGQVLAMQISNSPLSYGFQNMYAYNLAWMGHFTPWWKTIWSANMVEDEYHRMINYISLGNHWTFGNVAIDLDLMNRTSFKQKNPLSDYTVISKLIWSVGKWNYCAKVGYESNALDNVDANGLAFDTVIAPGTEYLYGGVGIEYFPLGNPTLRLHTAYFRDNFDHRNNLQIGITWRFNVISR